MFSEVNLQEPIHKSKDPGYPSKPDASMNNPAAIRSKSCVLQDTPQCQNDEEEDDYVPDILMSSLVVYGLCHEVSVKIKVQYHLKPQTYPIVNARIEDPKSPTSQ